MRKGGGEENQKQAHYERESMKILVPFLLTFQRMVETFSGIHTEVDNDIMMKILASSMYGKYFVFFKVNAFALARLRSSQGEKNNYYDKH